MKSLSAERQGFEPWHRLPDDRLAICSVTTPAPLLKINFNRNKKKFVTRLGLEPRTPTLKVLCSTN